MRSARMSAVVFGLVAIAVLTSGPELRAQSIVGPVAPAKKLCQLTGEHERQLSAQSPSGWPGCLNNNSCPAALNQTESRFGLRGTDLGSSFVDLQGNVRMLFGDTWPGVPYSPEGSATGWQAATTNPWEFPGFTIPRVSSSDSWAGSAAKTQLDLCVAESLTFVPDKDGFYGSFVIDDESGANGIKGAEVPLGAFEVPVGGFVANSETYVFFVTEDADHCLPLAANPGCTHPPNNMYNYAPGGRTVLAVQTFPSNGNPSTFTPLYWTSQYSAGETPDKPLTGAFMNIAPVVGKDLPPEALAAIPDVALPPTFTAANTLFVFGTSNYSRLSDVYLAVVRLDQIAATPQLKYGGLWPSSWWYYTGSPSPNGPWSQTVTNAVGLTGSLTAGEISVRYVEALPAGATTMTGSWLLLEAAPPVTVPRTIGVRSAPLPWGAWSAPNLNSSFFDVVDGACTYIHALRGTLQSSWPEACLSDDMLTDPGRGPQPGLTYAPYLVPSQLFTSNLSDPTRTNVSFAMSTANPYEVDLMGAQVGLDSDGDGIADYVDNCPMAPNLDQWDTNWLAELTLDPCVPAPQLPGCPAGVTGDDGLPPSPTNASPYATTWWHAQYPGDACDTNATTGITQSLGTLPFEVSLQFEGYIGNANGNAASGARSTSDVSFCQCGVALDPFRFAQCYLPANLGGQSLCIPASDQLDPNLGGVGSGWKTITVNNLSGTSTGPAFKIAHQERTDTNGYVPRPSVQEWVFTDDLSEFGQTSTLTGPLWAHVQESTFTSASTSGETAPATNYPNAYVPTTVTRPNYAVFHGGLPCGEAPIWIVLQNNPNPYQPPYGCFPHVLNGGLTAFVESPRQPVLQMGTSTAAQPLVDAVESGAAQVVVGDDVASGPPFGFTGTPALVVQTGSTNILGGLQLENGQIAPVGGVTAPSVGPDPPTLRSYAAIQGSLWGLTTLSGASTLARQDVRRALAGQQSVSVMDVVGATPVNAQAMVWSRGDGNLWALDVVPSEHGKSEVRFVRIDILGGAAETWRLRATEHVPDALFLSASGQGEILVGLSIHDHSEVALLDARGQAHWSAEMDGTLLSAPVATTAGIGMPMTRPLTGDHTNLDVRFIEREDLAPGLCGARWLREHARVPSAQALRGADGDGHDCEDHRR